ncbi:hypothetical protein Y032_0011g1421 [Ancylostoma ceylanicum]|uniref:Uncharacterized protein n=1 Tax=Ancylostoma ceylanicum TaxID=53326 RepID=A0A016VDV4_9BILA|nr:hypothetical protein Y032_0011g1421 [Ancylostoma ceylanicum]
MSSFQDISIFIQDISSRYYFHSSIVFFFSLARVFILDRRKVSVVETCISYQKLPCKVVLDFFKLCFSLAFVRINDDCSILK